MAKLRRRGFLSGACAGSVLMTTLGHRLVAQADAGADGEPINLIVLSCGNGWGHQGMARDGTPLDTTVASRDQWALPGPLAPFSGLESKTTILRSFRCPGDGNLHGSGWSTLTCMRGDGQNANGLSLDRLVGTTVGSEDPFSSVALGVATGPGRAAPCASSDGPLRAFPAIANPIDAYVTLFGGLSREEALARLASEQSLLDAMVEDIGAKRSTLGIEYGARMDQMLESVRELERQLQGRLDVLAEHEPPELPPGDLGASGLQPEVIRAHAQVGAHAVGFGLTRVLHLSLLGFNDHNAGWGAIGHPGDAHEGLMHKETYSGAEADQAVHDIISFEAQIAREMWDVLEGIPCGDGNVADRTVILWVNSGGGKHHDGRNYHPAVLLGDAAGSLVSGQYLQYPDRPNLNQLYLTLAQATGVDVETFGEPEDCPGPLAELQA